MQCKDENKVFTMSAGGRMLTRLCVCVCVCVCVGAGGGGGGAGYMGRGPGRRQRKEEVGLSHIYIPTTIEFLILHLPRPSLQLRNAIFLQKICKVCVVSQN